MYQINNEKFGQFLAEIRKEKQMTQKELAEKLFVSDKTVSKWERGNSMPNVTLLIPIADVLGITVTELLKGEKLREEKTLNSDEVENLVVNEAPAAVPVYQEAAAQVAANAAKEAEDDMDETVSMEDDTMIKDIASIFDK